MEYGQDSGGGSWIVVVALLLLLFGGVFWLFGNRFDSTEGIHAKVFGESDFAKDAVVSKFKTKTSEFREVIQPPAKENVWCNIQEIQVGTDADDLVRDRIVGWDNLDNCCVREVQGFNCALQRDSTMRYCYTANVGATIKYAQVDGYFVDKEVYKSVLEDYDRRLINGKVCDLEKYPKSVK
ncbi:hypothetical protein CMI37_09310 [Candidatus Pacearchaeota archaeon]|nr:hypothetical protein [Candidatus Pacearchaeota archaeon]